LPQNIIGIIREVIAREINPQAINIFWSPSRSIQGEIANGIPILTALRMNAIPVKASPVI